MSLTPNSKDLPPKSTKGLVAVVTMVYNEPDFLPFWVKYYSKEVGAENCFILDHCSDPSTLVSIESEMTVIGLPRTPLDDILRADLVSAICAMLLGRYETVIYCDVDEIIVPDPRKYTGLIDFSSRNRHDVVTVFGADIIAVEGESVLDASMPITAQRHFARPFSGLCKPLITRRRTTWGPGFHFCDSSSVFSGVAMFHLAYVDFDIIERRQKKRVATPRDWPPQSHHSIPPEEMVRHIAHDYAKIPRALGAKWGTGEADYERFMTRLMVNGGVEAVHHSGVHSETLWEIPAYYSLIF